MGKVKRPSQFRPNTFRPGNLARRKPEYVTSGGWKWGYMVFKVARSEYGCLIPTNKEMTGDFYYGFFEKVIVL